MFFLGMDVSTTATKALIIDAAGEVRGVSAAEYGFETPQPLWSEQHPDLWWQGAQTAIRGAIEMAGVRPDQIAAVGLTGQMHGLVLLDKHGKVLRKAILWNDQRTGAQCEAIHQVVGQAAFIRISGNLALPGFTAPKVLWVKEHEPEIYQQTAHILLPKDYVRYQLTSEFAMDKADGSGTVLMDLAARDWSGQILDSLGIPREWMPALYEGPQVTGIVTTQAAAATGLKQGTPIVAGGGDQAAQGVGVGAVREGVVALTLGTSGVVFTSTDKPFIDPEGRLHAFCHALPDKWHLMGVMLSAAGSLRWYRDTFASGSNYEALLAPAGDIPPGAEGLLFLPYLTGERTPYPDPMARGAFVGLTVRHGMAACTRAVLEGVAFGLRDSFALIRSAGVEQIDQVRVSGGGARSALWRQILADVLETELVSVNTTEGAAFGAALLAGVGVQHWPDVQTTTDALITVKEKVLPVKDNVDRYQDFYGIYRDLYPGLRESFNRLGRL